jgi:phage tail-like protein
MLSGVLPRHSTIIRLMPTGTRVDPFSSNNFRVEIDGIAPSDFMEVSGIEAAVTEVDYRSGTDKSLAARKLPGEVVYSNIVLRRGVTADASLWLWMKLALDGTVERKNMSVILLDEAGNEVVRWNFSNAWPVKWSGPVLNAEVSSVAVESLEIAHEGISR